MDQIMYALQTWIDKLEEKRKLSLTYLSFVFLGLALTVAGFFFSGVEALQVILGSVAGGLWFVALYIIWYKVLSEDMHDRLNYRMNVNVITRRRFTLPILVVWFVLLIFIYRNYEFLSPLIGAVNVVVLLIVWRMVTMNQFEREQSELSFMEEQERELWIQENTPVIPEVDVEIGEPRKGLSRFFGRRK